MVSAYLGGAIAHLTHPLPGLAPITQHPLLLFLPVAFGAQGRELQHQSHLSCT